MHLWHPTIVHFAIAFFVAAVVTELLKLFTGKRFWGLVARYHLLAAAIMSFLAVLTGFADYKVIFMNETGYAFIRSHAIVGFFVFILIQLMANYKFLMEKMLPEKMKMAYLILGGLGIGLVFGASFLGKAAVYSHGAGVTVAMMNYYETEKYLKELYGLDNLRNPTREDSVRAAQYYPGPVIDSTLSDTLSHQVHNTSHEPDPKNISIHKPPSLSNTANDQTPSSENNTHAKPPIQGSEHKTDH